MPEQNAKSQIELNGARCIQHKIVHTKFTLPFYLDGDALCKIRNQTDVAAMHLFIFSTMIWMLALCGQ